MNIQRYFLVYFRIFFPFLLQNIPIFCRKSQKKSIENILKNYSLLFLEPTLTLMRIEKTDERRFCEIECSKNNWSVRELQRQLDSGLYTSF